MQVDALPSNIQRIAVDDSGDAGQTIGIRRWHDNVPQQDKQSETVQPGLFDQRHLSRRHH